MGDKGIMAVGDDIGDGMQCADHPHNNTGGGICALCLKDKLGKLVSSNGGRSSPFLNRQPSSSSSSPSEYGTMGPATRTAGSGSSGGRTKASFLSASTSASAQKKKNRKVPVPSSSSTTTTSNVMMMKRSKSVAPRPLGEISDVTAQSPRKKSFWSFLHLSSSATTSSSSSSSNNKRASSASISGGGGDRDLKQQQQADAQQMKEDQEVVAESPASSSSFGRKVSRSRSVGCGSRSFSGDFLERISTGFGDCTLRRVESHRESSSFSRDKKMVIHRNDNDGQRIKERVKCAGIFGSSTYWLSDATSVAEDEDFDMGNGRSGAQTARASTSAIVRGGGSGSGRSKTWGWTFASPMRALKPATSKSNAISSSSSSNGKIINGDSDTIAMVC